MRGSVGTHIAVADEVGILAQIVKHVCAALVFLERVVHHLPGARETDFRGYLEMILGPVGCR